MKNHRKDPNGHTSSVIGLLGAEIPSRPSAPLRGATLLSLQCSLASTVPLGTGSSVPARACLLWLWCHPCPALRHHSWVSFMGFHSLLLWNVRPTKSVAFLSQVLHTASSKIHIQPRTARAKRILIKTSNSEGLAGRQVGGLIM